MGRQIITRLLVIFGAVNTVTVFVLLGEMSFADAVGFLFWLVVVGAIVLSLLLDVGKMFAQLSKTLKGQGSLDLSPEDLKVLAVISFILVGGFLLAYGWWDVSPLTKLVLAAIVGYFVSAWGIEESFHLRRDSFGHEVSAVRLELRNFSTKSVKLVQSSNWHNPDEMREMATEIAEVSSKVRRVLLQAGMRSSLAKYTALVGAARAELKFGHPARWEPAMRKLDRANKVANRALERAEVAAREASHKASNKHFHAAHSNPLSQPKTGANPWILD